MSPPGHPMDFAFFEFLKRLERTIMSLSARIKRVADYLLSRESELVTENADLKEKLAAAMANDAADAEQIAAAQADAAAARAEADTLRGELEQSKAALAEDATDDAEADAVLAPIEARIPVEG
jgi:chromosome segregation ATPase